MTIKWSPQAFNDLESIYEFYAQKSIRTAQSFYQALIQAVLPLSHFPEMAPCEPLLDGYAHKYRGLVVKKHYKIIYYTTEDSVYIVAIWDCRQSQSRLLRWLK